MCIDVPAVPPITIDGEALDYVEDFTHLGSLISCDNGTEKDVRAHLNKARGAFSRMLRPSFCMTLTAGE